MGKQPGSGSGTGVPSYSVTQVWGRERQYRCVKRQQLPHLSLRAGEGQTQQQGLSKGCMPTPPQGHRAGPCSVVVRPGLPVQQLACKCLVSKVGASPAITAGRCCQRVTFHTHQAELGPTNQPRPGHISPPAHTPPELQLLHKETENQPLTPGGYAGLGSTRVTADWQPNLASVQFHLSCKPPSPWMTGTFSAPRSSISLHAL